MREQPQIMGKQAQNMIMRIRAFVRRAMPRVAIAATILFLLWLFISRTQAYERSTIGALFGVLTFIIVSFTSVYYGFKAFRYLKQRLLWRVRLVVTYLFVGLTPIILLGLLGLFFAIGVGVSRLTGSVTNHISNTEKQALANAHIVADNFFARLPANADRPVIQTWLDEQNSILQASSPGARLALWRGGRRLSNAWRKLRRRIYKRHRQ